MNRIKLSLATLGLALSLGACQNMMGEDDVIEPAAGPAGTTRMDTPDPIIESEESAQPPAMTGPQGPDLGDPPPTSDQDLPAVR